MPHHNAFVIQLNDPVEGDIRVIIWAHDENEANLEASIRYPDATFTSNLGPATDEDMADPAIIKLNPPASDMPMQDMQAPMPLSKPPPSAGLPPNQMNKGY